MCQRMPSAPGRSSHRVAPILAFSGREKARWANPVSASSPSQGTSANRFWRFIRLYLRCASGYGRAVGPPSGGRVPRHEVRAASTPPDPRGDPRGSTQGGERSISRILRRPDYHATAASPPRGGALTITDRPEDSPAVHGLRVVGRILR